MVSSLENIGQSGVDISKVKIYGWIFGRFMRTNDRSVISIDYDRIQQTDTAFYEATYDVSDIKNDTTRAMLPPVGHIPPGGAASFELNFIAERKESKWIVFLIEYYEGDEIATSAWGGSPMCAPSISE